MKNQAFLPKKPRLITSNEGNAIIISLVVIVLLGVLTVMLMRSSGRISNNYSTEQTRMAASKLLRSAQDIESGVVRLVSVNGCGENALDFTNTKTTKSYAHIPVSADTHCQLYDIEGVGMAYSPPITTVLDSTKSASTDYGQWVFLGGQCVVKVGTGDGSVACADSELELMLVVRYLTSEACLEINNLLKMPTASTADGIPTAGSDTTSTGFKGTFAAVAPTEIGGSGTGATLIRQPTGCFNDSSAVGTYTFYHTLLSR